MRLGLPSDIHGNAYALRAVLADAEPRSIEHDPALVSRLVEVAVSFAWTRGLDGILAGCQADLVIGGYTHDVTDRHIGAVRAVNLGIVSNPTRADRKATYVVIDADPTGHVLRHRFVDDDHDAFVQRLDDVRHPAAAYIQQFQRAN